MKNETWKPVVDWPGYLVSSLGRVKALARIVPCKNGTIKSVRKRLLKQHLIGSDNRFAVTLSLGGHHKYQYTARLVCIAFHGNATTGMEVSHIDGNKVNNCVQNLKWETHKDNENRKVEHDTHIRGERQGSSKLRPQQIIAIRSTYAAGRLYQYEIAEQYGVSQSHIHRIVKRKEWTHI